jgi:hypothetical protein
MDAVEKFITGVIAIGVVTAFALNAKELSGLVTSTGGAASGLMNTAEKG